MDLQELTSTTGASGLLLRDAVTRALAPRPRISVSEWADRHRVLTEKESSRPGRWLTATTPNLRAPMDAFGDPKVRHISIIKPTQRGGTEIVINGVLYLIDYAPGDMFWVWSNADNAREFLKLRFLPAVKACAPTAAKLTLRKHDAMGTELVLSNMTIRFRGAPPHGQGIRSLESWPARYIANDELDRCDPNTPEVMSKRVASYPTSSKRIDLGSPEDENEGIDRQVKLSAGGGLYYWMPCLHCGTYFVPEFFANVFWLGGSKADPEEVRKKAQLQCRKEGCEGVMNGHQHKVMMQRGVWAPDWNENAPVEENPLPPPERIEECLHAPHVGFRIGEFDTPFALNPYGDVAAEFIKNGGENGGVTRTWVTHTRGRPWQAKGDRLEEHELMALCLPVGAGGYRLGTVPAGVLALETAIDVQEREAWVRVRGWGRGGGESWLVWVERVDLPGGDLSPLDKIVNGGGWAFPLVTGARAWCDAAGVVPDGGGQPPHMRAVVTSIDSGDRTVEVYRWAMRHGGARSLIFPTKGQPGTTGGGAQKTQWATPLSLLPDGTQAPKDAAHKLLLVNVNTNAWKTWLLGRVRAAKERGPVGEGAVDAEGGGGLGTCIMRYPAAEFEPGVDEEATSHARLRAYFRQLTAEHRVTKNRGGRLVKVWEKRAGGGRDNHYFDTEVHGAAVLALRSADGAQLDRVYGLVNPAAAAGGGAGEQTKRPAPAAADGGDREQPRFVRHLRGGGGG